MAFRSDDHLQNFYSQYIQQARNTLPGLTQSSPPQAGASANARYKGQQFIMWDYLNAIGASTQAEMSVHFAELQAYCVAQSCPRVIMLVRTQSLNGGFFDPTKTSGEYIRPKIAELVAAVPNIKFTFFFDNNSFTSSANGSGTQPSTPDAPSTTLAGYFDDIGNMLDWIHYMRVTAGVTAIDEVAFDPESGHPEATKDNYQDLYNYTDSYKWTNDMGNGSANFIKVGATVGIDGSKETYANVSEFPVNSIYTSQISTFPANPFPSWRAAESTANQQTSILQSMYIQCYETAISSIFSNGFNATNGQHNGNGDGSLAAGSYSAGQMFNQLLLDKPYLQGQGTITGTQHSPTVTGFGTNFTTFSDPIIYATEDFAQPNKKLGVVDSVTNNTSLALGSPYATASFSKKPFNRTEIVTAWDFHPVITQTMVDSIYWMFSVNYDAIGDLFFFGNWQLNDFMNFVDKIKELNNAAGTSTFTDGQLSPDDGSPIPIPGGNYVIYQYDFATSVVQTTPTYNGTVQPWNIKPGT